MSRDVTVRSQNAGSTPVAGHSSTISLMEPTQTPNLTLSEGPTPLPSANIPPQVLDSLSATQRVKVQGASSPPTSFANADILIELDQRPPASQSSITLRSPKASGEASLGFDADQLRRFMNQQSLNPMASGHVLSEKKSKWQVIEAEQTSGHSTGEQKRSIERTVASQQAQILPRSIQQQTSLNSTVAENPFRMASNSREGVQPELSADSSQDATRGTTVNEASWNDLSDQQPFPTITDGSASRENETRASADGGEDSMLDRLKGLYDPGEDGVARRIWKRQIPKLPNPWSVFRDRDAPVAAELSTPESTVVMPDATLAGEVADATPVESSLLTQLVDEYETRLASWPKTPAERPENPERYQELQQELRLLYLMQNRPEEALSAVEMLSPAEQQFWQSMMMSLAEYRTAKSSESPTSHFTGSVHQLRTALQALSPLAELRIRRLEICDRIHSYGRVETFPSNDFDPGRPLLLYVELENFGTQLTASGRYLASFDATLQIFEKGKEAAKETIRLTDITDESTSARTDYFQSYDLTLPSHLMTGEYEIRLKLRDKLTGKTTQSSVGFQVR